MYDGRLTLRRSTMAEAELSRQIISLYQRMLEAWNRRDADGFAALFTHNGSIVGFDGSQMNGRTQAASELRAIFSSHPTASYVAKVREVRQLDTHVVLLRAVVGMVPPGQHELNPAVNAVQSVLAVLDRGEPAVALLHNTPAAFHARAQLAEQLTQELAAILRAGEIVDAGDYAAAR
jgi:uncharacterized protein (TIGR02246 family)